jgi:hypothetical protein
VIDLGEVSCASCHTRLMPDGSMLMPKQHIPTIVRDS